MCSSRIASLPRVSTTPSNRKRGRRQGRTVARQPLAELNRVHIEAVRHAHRRGLRAPTLPEKMAAERFQEATCPPTKRVRGRASQRTCPRSSFAASNKGPYQTPAREVSVHEDEAKRRVQVQPRAVRTDSSPTFHEEDNSPPQSYSLDSTTSRDRCETLIVDGTFTPLRPSLRDGRSAATFARFDDRSCP